MRCKPVAGGLKAWVLTDSNGYVFRLLLHTTKSNIPDSELLGSINGVVLQLLSPIGDSQFVGIGHRLHLDNLYTNVPLARRLLLYKTFVLGTCRGTSSGIPKVFAKAKAKNSLANKQDRGFLAGASAPGLLALCWKDSKPVTLLCSEPSFTFRDQTVMKRRVKRDWKAWDKEEEVRKRAAEAEGGGLGEADDPDKPSTSAASARQRLQRPQPPRQQRPLKRKLPEEREEGVGEAETENLEPDSSASAKAARPSSSIDVTSHLAFKAYNLCEPFFPLRIP